MGKVNKKGRSKYEQHIRLHRGLTRSKAWKDLSCEARSLLIEIWERHNGVNNGQITYSIREAKSRLRIGTRKAMAAFIELQDTGFIICRMKGHFDCKIKHASEWEITDEECDGQPAKKLYRKYEERHPVLTLGTDGS